MRWKRRKRRAQLRRQLALGLLEDAMGRVEEQQGRSGASRLSGVRYNVIARVFAGSRQGPSPEDSPGSAEE